MTDDNKTYHIKKEPIDSGLSEEEVKKLCDLRKQAGAIECKREGDFLVTKWPIF